MRTFVIIYFNGMYKNHVKIMENDFEKALKAARIFCKNTNNKILGIVEEEHFHL